MGYHTDFDGVFNLDNPLTEAQKTYLQKFASTRRMKRDEAKVAELSDPVREAVGLPVGTDGGYFVGSTGFMGQDNDASVLDHNYEPSDQPGLWCQWAPNEDGTCIEWDGGEKFYEYVPWIKYIITHFLKPWGRTLNGVVSFRGEHFNDVGDIVITNNEVAVKYWRR